MPPDLDELNARLNALEASLPAIIEQHPAPSDFWAAFLGQADALEAQAGEHREAVAARLAAMLAQHGCYIATVEP